jgi:hypothetical protein
MRSVNALFKRVQNRNPSLSSYSALATAVKDKHFSRKALNKAFKSAVPKEDFLPQEKKKLIDYLEKLTKGV